MRLRFAWILGLIALGGCEVAVPNGLFGCGQPSDCPSGYFCWSSDSRCYDSKEPDCVPKTCDQVIGEFASLGIRIECGSLPDGCDGAIECGGCPEGTVCGANGENFICGCEENTCASYRGGAECGGVPARCGGAEQTIFCGECFGDYVCMDNRCVCPPGVVCDDGCMGGEPTYPCTQHECSPPGGLPDGCGGFAHCPTCSNDEQCVLSDELTYECLGDCTCEAQDVECGSATICGSPTLCGTCADNGFGAAYRCESGRCVCEDSFEYNDSFDRFALICGEGTGLDCMQDAWAVDIQATLHSSKDVDYYALQVLDTSTSVVAQTYDGLSDRMVYLTYICPDGFEGMAQCSGSTYSMEGIEFCLSKGDTVTIERKCDKSASSNIGTVLVGIKPTEFQGDCDLYGLNVFATYQYTLPVQ